MKPIYLIPAGLLTLLATLAFTTVNADPRGEGRHGMGGGYGGGYSRDAGLYDY